MRGSVTQNVSLKSKSSVLYQLYSQSHWWRGSYTSHGSCHAVIFAKRTFLLSDSTFMIVVLSLSALRLSLVHRHNAVNRQIFHSSRLLY